MIRTLTIFIFCFASYLQAADSKSKPNVLFIISDDLNYMLGSMGHPEAKTPHLDAFAKTATSFSRAYCQFPLCGPSRASIMTGQYPFKNGVTGNKNSVDPDRVTLPKHFQNHGYWAGRISKIYHMGIPGDIIMGTPGGDHAPSWNKAVNIRALETMTPGKVVDYDVPDAPLAFSKERKVWQTAADEKADYEMIPEARGNYAVIEVDKANEHLLADKMATDKAIELLQRRKQKDTPFFLAVGLVRPHFPFVALDENLTPYDTDTLAFPEHPADDYDDIPFQAINSKKDFKHQEVLEIRRGYYGAVTYMDQQFGRIMAEMDKLDLRKNTIIVFVSDHGYLLGEHSMWKKTKLWEDSIHVPLMISTPGQREGQRCDQLVELIDLYPTLTELAGLPAEKGAQGLSLTPLLTDPLSARPEKTASLSQTPSGHCLRTKKWAYMWYPKKKKHPAAAMLFDMETDPQQFTNLSGNPDYAEIEKTLHDQLQARIKAAIK